MDITKDMTIGEVVQKYPKTVQVFQRLGMTCLGCPATQFESLEQGAMVHGLELDQLLKELNGVISG